MNNDNKINEIADNELEQVSGGIIEYCSHPYTCTACGHSSGECSEVFYSLTDDQYAYLVCKACGHKEINAKLG